MPFTEIKQFAAKIIHNNVSVCVCKAMHKRSESKILITMLNKEKSIREV